MANTHEPFDSLKSLGSEFRGACTEVALITTAKQPYMQLDSEVYVQLSVRAKAFVDGYPNSGSLTSRYCFFEDLYKWGVLHHEEGTNKPTHVGAWGALLVDEYFQDQLSPLS